MARMTMITAFLTLACLFTGWPDAGAECVDEVALATLKENLQSAIELEWATIPPYLTAWLSIKDGTNGDVRDMLKGIYVDEMHHLALAANMLNAIGGEPVLNDPGKAPRYPGPLPAGALPSLTVTLEKMSRAHTKKVFMGIETPECHESVRKFFPVLSKAASSKASEEDEKSPVDKKFPGLLDKCNEKHYIPKTIGGIYIHKILCPMLKLEKDARACEPIRQTIFKGDHERQLSNPFKIRQLFGAVRAIALIVSQGEGGDPCNPYVDDQFAKSEKEPSHYFKFAEVVHGKKVDIGVNTREPYYYFSPCDGTDCGNVIGFDGTLR